MPRERVISERETRAAGKVAQKEDLVDWLSVIPQLKIQQLVRKELREEEAETDRKMAEIAAKDAANAARLGFNPDDDWGKFLGSPDASKVMAKLFKNPKATVKSARTELVESQNIIDRAGDKSVNAAIDKANRRRQEARPGNRKHPIVQLEIIPERRLERELHSKPRKPKKEDWKTRIANSPAWQEALRWFNMTPAERTAAISEIEDALNTETGAMAQTLINQAEMNVLEETGALEQMDFFGFLWPTGEELPQK